MALVMSIGQPGFSDVLQNIVCRRTPTLKSSPEIEQSIHYCQSNRLYQLRSNDFVTAGTITQAILDDPNTVLRNTIQVQNINQAIVFTVSTSPPTPKFGGGTDNIAFLLGDPTAQTPNSNIFQMDATFWIETVEYSLVASVDKPGQAPVELPTPVLPSGQPGPVFLISPPYEITSPKTITVTSKKIQYSQVVFMNFDNITWPQISVSTLIPATPVPVPDSVWDENENEIAVSYDANLYDGVIWSFPLQDNLPCQ